MYAIPTQDARTIAKRLEDFTAHHGVPKVILSDQGKNFESSVISEFCQIMGIDKRHTTAYHPQCDGLVERLNRTLWNMLSMYVSTDQKDWDNWLPQVALAYRTSTHDSTGQSPFMMLYGQEARLPADIIVDSHPNDHTCQPTLSNPTAYTRDLGKRLRILQQEASKRIRRSQARQKRNYDKDAFSQSFQVGARVWLYTPQRRRGRSPKLMHNWHGPYTIVRQTSEVDYEVLSDSGRRRQVVHHNRLKPCDTPKQQLPPRTPQMAQQTIDHTNTPVSHPDQSETEDELWLPIGPADEPLQSSPMDPGNGMAPGAHEQRRYPLRPRHPPLRFGDWVTH